MSLRKDSAYGYRAAISGDTMTMMRTIIALAMLLMATPASAYTCQDVRGWVAQYGTARLLVMARMYGVTKDQIQQARACFTVRRAKFNEARLSSSEHR